MAMSWVRDMTEDTRRQLVTEAEGTLWGRDLTILPQLPSDAARNKITQEQISEFQHQRPADIRTLAEWSAMVMGDDKHKGSTLASIFIRHPGYVVQMCNRQVTNFWPVTIKGYFGTLLNIIGIMKWRRDGAEVFWSSPVSGMITQIHHLMIRERHLQMDLDELKRQAVSLKEPAIAAVLSFNSLAASLGVREPIYPLEAVQRAAEEKEIMAEQQTEAVRQAAAKSTAASDSQGKAKAQTTSQNTKRAPSVKKVPATNHESLAGKKGAAAMKSVHVVEEGFEHIPVPDDFEHIPVPNLADPDVRMSSGKRVTPEEQWQNLPETPWQHTAAYPSQNSSSGATSSSGRPRQQ